MRERDIFIQARDQPLGEADDRLTAACLHRLNRPSEAQTWLRRAVSRFDAEVPKPGTDAQGNLEDYLIFHALRREVEALIGSAAVDTSP
jgi:hypothetical protein